MQPQPPALLREQTIETHADARPGWLVRAKVSFAHIAHDAVGSSGSPYTSSRSASSLAALLGYTWLEIRCQKEFPHPETWPSPAAILRLCYSKARLYSAGGP